MSTNEEKRSFGKFDFDERLQKIVAEMGWEKPTPVQVEMIPLMLNDKNILARARTGSGKTAAFLLPLIQKILHLTTNKSSEKRDGPFAMIVAPTKELATQIYIELEKLIAPFPYIQCFNLAQYIDSHDHTLGNELLDIIVGTPGRLLDASAKTPDLFKGLHCVVLDEADLLFSYGYQDEIKRLKCLLPAKYQTIMTSATLNEDLSQLKRDFVIGKVVSLKLKEPDLPGLDQLEQFHISCKNDEERFTIFLALIKLKLLIGKSVIFVSSIDRCYKLHLFLQSFKVPSCVLNAQMPANSRCRIIYEFNQGRWPFLIASECNEIFDESGDNQAEEQSEIKEDKEKTKKEKRREVKKKNRNRFIDKESGMGRGIDFHLVPNVVNFDFPTSGDMYVHRVGRTARGFNKGTAISFSTMDEQKLFEQIKEEIDQRMGMPVIRPYEVRIKDFESFQLRARDVLAACTRTVIRETRMSEIRNEILQSKRLDSYFAKNPRERWVLEQDRKQFKLNVHSPGIADVPDYIVPKALRGQNFNNGKSTDTFVRRKRMMNQQNVVNGEISEEDDNGPKRKSRKHKFYKGDAKRKFNKQMADPLRSFKF